MGRLARSGHQWMGKEAGSGGHEDGCFWAEGKPGFRVVAG